MTQIASTAIVDPKAELADDVQIGHFCVIGPKVTLGPGCVLHNNVTIVGRTTVGRGNAFFQHAVIGAVPQDLKYKGEDSEVIIGDGNAFRENVTVHLGTMLGGGKTVIGNHCLFMVGIHVGHDSHIDDHVVIANNVLLGGHVKIEAGVVIGGGAAVHHFVTIGRYAMIGGLTRIVTDIPPFMIYEGNPGEVRAVNTIGLSRKGFDESHVDAVKTAFRQLYRKKTPMRETLKTLAVEYANDENVQHLIASLERSMQGRHGRYLETCRCDSASDIGQHFNKKAD
jgi:UDP-N-acetylglucosamine acyltransferase